MLRLALAFFLLAIFAAVLGFGGLAGALSGLAQIAFVLFLVIAVLSLLFGRRVAV